MGARSAHLLPWAHRAYWRQKCLGGMQMLGIGDGCRRGSAVHPCCDGGLEARDDFRDVVSVEFLDGGVKLLALHSFHKQFRNLGAAL